jgi:hypothetical protein
MLPGSSAIQRVHLEGKGVGHYNELDPAGWREP